MLRPLLIVAVVLAWLSNPLHADSFTGVYGGVGSDGPDVLEITQAGTRVTGTFAVAGMKLKVTGVVSNGRVDGSAVLEGSPVSFVFTLRVEGDHLVGELTERDENGQPDPRNTEKIVFTRKGGGTASPASPPQGDRKNLDSIAGRVKSNFKPEGGAKVLAQGTPPLTRESVNAFAEILRITFGVELTEAEYNDTVAVFVSYYQGGDAQTRTMLATGWQQILAELGKQTGAARQKSIDEVRTVLAQRFAGGAQAGIPWAVAMNATIQRRASTVATMKAPVPDYAKKSDLHQAMTEADLDAAMEMLYFMWVAAGRDAALVTPQAVAVVRQAIVQNFPTFPAEVQLIFANAQKVYSALRGQWAQATPAVRQQMAAQFSTSLDQLGLRVPGRGSSNAWSNVGGKTHGEWAGEMVQGLAGSSYHSSW